MSRPTLCAALAPLALVGLLVLSGSPQARAEDGSKTVETTWTVTRGDSVVGTETLRTVVSESGTRFGATNFKPADKGDKGIVSHLQRTADGTLRRYRRAFDVRKGEELIAFSKPSGVRIVGKNSKRKAVEVPGAQRYMLWDPTVWALAWEWVDGRKAQAPVTLSVLNVPKGKTTKLTLTPDGAFVLYDDKAQPVEANSWLTSDVGGDPFHLFVGAGGEILAAKRGDRAMIRSGWSWKQLEPPAEVPEGEPASAEENGDPEDPTTKTAPEDRAAP